MNAAEYPYYYDIIKEPMYLEKMMKRSYRNRKEFLSDIELIVQNVHSYSNFNGDTTLLAAANKLSLFAKELLEKQSESWWRDHEEPSKPPKKTSSKSSLKLIPSDIQRNKNVTILNGHLPSEIEDDSSGISYGGMEDDGISTEEDPIGL